MLGNSGPYSFDKSVKSISKMSPAKALKQKAEFMQILIKQKQYHKDDYVCQMKRLL